MPGLNLGGRGNGSVCASSGATNCSIRVGRVDLHGGTGSAGKRQAVSETEGYRCKHWPDEELTDDFKVCRWKNDKPFSCFVARPAFVTWMKTLRILDDKQVLEPTGTCIILYETN